MRFGLCLAVCRLRAARVCGGFLLALPITFIFCSADSVGAEQAATPYRIGYLAPGTRTAGTEAFLEGLRGLGYVEGKNIVIDYRWAEGKEDRLSALAAEILRLNPSVVVVGGSIAARAVQKLTQTIPIVVPDSADPVGSGLVKTFARPGGNITGLTFMAPQLGSKRIELLKEAFPRITEVAVVTRAPRPDELPEIKEMRSTAPKLGMQLQVIATSRDAGEIEDLFSVLIKKRVHAFVLIPSPLFTYRANLIVDLAARNVLPAMYPHSGFVRVGGLMSYAANLPELFRRAASFVDKILKGANPADMPMEPPTKFELVVNLKTAKQLGVTIPAEILLEANEVIK